MNERPKTFNFMMDRRIWLTYISWIVYICFCGKVVDSILFT